MQYSYCSLVQTVRWLWGGYNRIRQQVCVYVQLAEQHKENVLVEGT
jgi:hypothetical protein